MTPGDSLMTSVDSPVKTVKIEPGNSIQAELNVGVVDEGPLVTDNEGTGIDPIAVPSTSGTSIPSVPSISSVPSVPSGSGMLMAPGLAESIEYTLNKEDGSCICNLCGEMFGSRTHWYRHKYKVYN